MSSFFINQDTDQPMTNTERRQKYPSGACPLCGARSWHSACRVDEDELLYLVVCDECDSSFISDD